MITLQKAVDAWDDLRSHIKQADDVPMVFPDTEERVMDYFKMAARTAHPDTGGSTEAFVAVDRAKHILLEWLKRAPAKEVDPLKKHDCPHCGGTGRKRVQFGFKSMTMVCGSCHGSGDTAFQPDKTGD